MKKLISDPTLAPYAGCFSNLAVTLDNTRGRISKDDGWVVCDRQRIARSESFQLSQGKTKVFLNHLNDFRLFNNQKHANEVAFLAGEVCRFLGLNDILAEAIALGHDVGYPPFGPVGVKVLSNVYGEKFKHASAGVVVLQEVENFGDGLNLCYETLLGIDNHSFGKRDFTFKIGLPLEVYIAAIVDKFSFIFGDIKDGFTCGYFKTKDELPKDYPLFGWSKHCQWQTCVNALIKESVEKGKISFVDSDEAKRFNELRTWSYENFYYKIDQEDYRVKLYDDLLHAFHFLQACTQEVKDENLDPAVIFTLLTNTEAKRLITDARRGETPSIDLLKDFQCLENIRGRKNEGKPNLFKAKLETELFHNF